LRTLGAPLVDIDITDEQMEDRIDEAIAFFNEYYFDGVEKMLMKHQITATFSTGYKLNISGDTNLIGKLYIGSVESTTGVNLIEGRYSAGTIFNLGTLRVSGAPYLAYGLKADNTVSGGWLSSSGGALGRSAFVANGGYLAFWALGTTTVADGTTISPTELGRWNTSGLGVGTNDPLAKLHIIATSGNIAARFTDSSATTEYVDIYRYGLQFSRSASYLRPASNDSQVLYVGLTESSQKWQLIRLDATTIAFNNHANISVLKTNASGYLQAATQADISGVLGDFYIKNQTTTQTANFNVSGYGIINAIKIHNGGVVGSTYIGGANTGNTSSGAANTIIGYNSLSATSTGNNNVTVGGYSMTATTSGSGNAGLGYSSLLSNTVGEYNVALGYASMYSSVSASKNIVIGYYAGRYLGNSASASAINGYNIALGWTTMQGNSTDTTLNIGAYNVAIGYQSMYINESGSNNNAIGNGAGHDNKTGVHNVFMGMGSGYTNRASGYNVGIGTNTFRYYNDSEVATYGFNVAIGYKALEGSATAANNTFTYTTAVGVSAGQSITTGSYNTFLGYIAGASITTGGYNILLGRNAGSSITTGIGNVMLGAHNGSAIATLNNWMVFSDGNGTYKYQVSSSGRLIIGGTVGTDNTYGLLQVNGSIWTNSISVNKLIKTDSNGTLVAATYSDITTLLGAGTYIQNQNAAAQTGSFWINGAGRVGQLAINKNANDYAEIYFQKAGILQFNLYSYTDSPNNLYLASYNDAGEYITNIFTANRLTGNISFSNNVGIGNTSPNARLEVANGNIRISSSSAIKYEFNNSGNYYSWIETGGTVSSSYMRFASANTEVFRITNTGKFLINEATGNTYKAYINSGSPTGNGLYVNGKIFATDDIQSFSDWRLKSNIRDLVVGDKLKNLKVKIYSKNNREEIGLIAQDIQAIFPNMVGMQDNFLTLNYNQVSSLALGLGLENKSEIEQLKEKISQLEKEIEELKK
jgi:hypothetical protein